MEEIKVFEKSLPGGTIYEILESHGFSGNMEIAIRIGGKEIASILSIRRKRNGNLVCSQVQSHRTFIEVKKEERETKKSLTLDDIVIPKNNAS